MRPEQIYKVAKFEVFSTRRRPWRRHRHCYSLLKLSNNSVFLRAFIDILEVLQLVIDELRNTIFKPLESLEVNLNKLKIIRASPSSVLLCLHFSFTFSQLFHCFFSLNSPPPLPLTPLCTTRFGLRCETTLLECSSLTHTLCYTSTR